MVSNTQVVKSKAFTLWLSPTELERLEQVARAVDLSRSEVLRRGIALAADQLDTLRNTPTDDPRKRWGFNRPRSGP
jgi:hypothetical protein